MHDGRLGSAIRLVRQRRRWTQTELAARARVSDSTVSRIERGHIGSLSVATIQEVAGALDIRVDLVPRWRAGDLDRLLNRRHATLHELVARWFGEVVPEWVLAPEVSYSIYGERGVIDILAWHPGRRALLIIELKTTSWTSTTSPGRRIGGGALPGRSSRTAGGIRLRCRCGSSSRRAEPTGGESRPTRRCSERHSPRTVAGCARGSGTPSDPLRRFRSGQIPMHGRSGRM